MCYPRSKRSIEDKITKLEFTFVNYEVCEAGLYLQTANNLLNTSVDLKDNSVSS